METFASFYSQTIYRFLVGTIGRFFGWFPFSMSEILLYLLILTLVYWLIRSIYQMVKKKSGRYLLKTLKRILILCLSLAIVFTLNCGINYRAKPFSAYADLKASEISDEKLEDLCRYLKDQINLYADDYVYKDGNQDQWEKEARRCMQKLGRQYQVLDGFYPEPKGLMVSYILSVQQLCGVYSPFTIEANYNRDMPNYNVPHTMCHELSHLRSFMREDEANFIGFLACIGSDEDAFRYSGYLMGFVYVGNELAKRNHSLYDEIYLELDEKAVRDLKQNNEFWDKYEGKVAETQEKVNDAYLKANGQKEGVKSYGRCVDLMLAWYEKEIWRCLCRK